MAKTTLVWISAALAMGRWTTNAQLWSKVDSAGPPPTGRSRCAATFLSSGDRKALELFGGASRDFPASNSLFSLDINGSWQSSQPLAGPSPRQFASATLMGLPVATERPKMFVYGGQTADGPSDEAWEVGLDEPPTWNRIQLTAGSDAMGKFPGPRSGHSLDAVPVPVTKWSPYPAPDGAAVLFGGSNGSHALADAWLLDMGGRVWHLLNSGIEPPGYPPAPGARVHHASAIVPEVNPNAAPMLFVFGGLGGTDPARAAALDDLWAYSLGEFMWANISSQVRADPVYGAPPARHGAVLRVVASASASNQTVLLLFGGVDKDGHALDDSWTLTVPRDMWGPGGNNQASWKLHREDSIAMGPTARAYCAAVTMWQFPAQNAQGSTPVADGVLLFGGEGDERTGGEPTWLNDAFQFIVQGS